MKPAKNRIFIRLPDHSVLGKLMSPSPEAEAFAPRKAWNREKSEQWFHETMGAFFKKHDHDPFLPFPKAEYAIIPARQVTAGVHLESGTIILTDSYLDYLDLISHHASVMQTVALLSENAEFLEMPEFADLIKDAETIIPELFTWLACNHLSGTVQCGRLISQLKGGVRKELIKGRYANWVVYTLLHELGHLDIFHRGISVESQKEEYYCDAFALKGWGDDRHLLNFTSDIMLLFTYQWPIDMRLQASRTHPPTFERARMILDGMNINGAFDDLLFSMGEFWQQGSTTMDLPYKERRDALASVRDQDISQRTSEYVRVMNAVLQLPIPD